MKRMSMRQAFWVMVGLAFLSWGVFALDAAFTGMVSPVALATALTFTFMLVAWPFLLGWRRENGRWAHRRVCRDCGSPSWPGLDVDFCIRCGSTRPAVTVGY